MSKVNNTVDVKKVRLDRNKKRLIFYVIMLAWPCLQYAFFYFYVNINSFVLAFQHYEANTTGQGGLYIVSPVFLDNFARAFEIIGASGDMILNSIVIIGMEVLVVASLSLFFSFYIVKKYLLSNFFKIILYIPTIVSSVVLVLLYKYILTDVFLYVFEGMMGKEWLVEHNLSGGLLGTETPTGIQFAVIIFYNLWVSFGINVILYSGGMSGIDPSIVESSHLDGVNVLQEFWYISFPMIWPTFVTLIVTSLTGIFTNQMNLLAFYGAETDKTVPFNVFGFYLYEQTVKSDYIASSAKIEPYSVLSALGLIITLVLVPVVLSVRKLLLKYGPSAG